MIPFHLAFPVHNLDQTRYFYGHILGCHEGRSAPRWIDFNFFGHQISAHLVKQRTKDLEKNTVDGDAVPTRHFGAILPFSDWKNLHQRIEKHNIAFRIEPKIRFVGEPGEQGTFFVDDPSGNCLEFKTFRDLSHVFASDGTYDK